MSPPLPRLRVNLSNIQGEGAVQLVGSLLPALDRQRTAAISRFDMPDRGALADYPIAAPGAVAVPYRRHLPNALSRLVECVRPLVDDDGGAVLVLGDVPLRTRGFQTVFVHTTHLLGHQAGTSRAQAVKFAAMRSLFARNLPFADRIAVQTERMRDALVHAYPALSGRIRIVRQPPPGWLLDHAPVPPRPDRTGAVRLFYPAAGYPHKNHRLIDALAERADIAETVEALTVTLPEAPERAPIRRVGRLGPEAMRREYARADALFFPSLSESYGLPLVEAMWLGLPIVAADLPYAHAMCGDQALYFDPMQPDSAAAAIGELARRLATGWRPDWTAALSVSPRTWDSVAERLVTIATDRSA